MLILERLAVDFRKKSKLGFEIYPSPNISTCIVEPYIGLLSTHWLLDHTDVSLVLDNEAIYTICQKKLDIKKPSYSNLNRIIAKVVSSMTAALRFQGELNVGNISLFFNCRNSGPISLTAYWGRIFYMQFQILKLFCYVFWGKYF